MLRKQFEEFGGYNDWFRCYGGGELYLDFKWWMLGSSVSVVPEAVGYHLSAGRGYSYHQDDLIHNMMLLAYALGATGFGDRVFYRYLGKDGVSKELMEIMQKDALKEAEHDILFLSRTPHMHIYDMFTQKPWDAKNMERHGKAQSYISIFDETWTKEMPVWVKEMMDASPYEKEIQERIKNEWSKYIYGREKIQ
jgi:hypothetical protein